MKLHVKSTTGGQSPFGPVGDTVEVNIEGQDYEAGQATVSAITILTSLGVSEMVDLSEDQENVVATSDDEDTPEDGFADVDADTVAAAGWIRPSDVPIKTDPDRRISNPGDAVRIIWEDGSSRIFIDDGHEWIAPAVAGSFPDPLVVRFDEPKVTVYVVGAQYERGTDANKVTVGGNG